MIGLFPLYLDDFINWDLLSRFSHRVSRSDSRVSVRLFPIWICGTEVNGSSLPLRYHAQTTVVFSLFASI
jgi:hypothetical protein